ncbi:MAG: hypothetical protein ACK4WF_00015 [Candidatus Brocadiales bacterium]
MYRLGTYLVLMLALSLTVFAGEDKPKGGSDGAADRQGEVAPDKDKKPVLSPPKAGEGAEGNAKSHSGPDKGEPSRDFLKLAEPKSFTGKKTPKGTKWGGYWGAVYRRSLDEEPEMGERDSGPEGGASTTGELPPALSKQKPTKPPERPASLAEYKEVDFARFASGSYASDYGDKYVKFHCRFASLAPEGMRLQDFPPPEHLNFIVVGTGSSMENLTVVARKEMADRVFRMESGKEITLYGRAHRLGLSGLTLVVDEIESVKK